MKKTLSVFLCAALLLVGCSSSNESEVETTSIQTTSSVSETSGTDTSSEVDDENDGLEVNAGSSDDVEITMPAALVGEDFDGELSEADKQSGFKSVVLNDDGSATFTLSKEGHTSLLKELKGEMDAYANTAPEEYPSIVSITINNDATEAAFVVDKAAFENSMDEFVAFGLYFQASFYQTFNGIADEDVTFTVEIEDSETGEVFKTLVYPDELTK